MLPLDSVEAERQRPAVTRAEVSFRETSLFPTAETRSTYLIILIIIRVQSGLDVAVREGRRTRALDLGVEER